jgi:DNA helicase-2/ATP-dependent DNA helicase PcrA
VAYNTRAANELVERLGSGTSATIRTIHSLGRAILAEARGEPLVLEERDMRQMIDRLAPVQHRPNTDAIGPYLEALGEVRIAFRDPARVEGERDDVPGFAEVFEQVKERLDRRNEADFDHMVFGAIQALLVDPALRRTWQRRCRHLLVDEFQDLTPAYLLLLRLLSSPSLDVFGVGDDDQVIYGYAGADPGYLIAYDELFPGAADHPLTTNHRSPRAVVDAAATLLTHNRRRVTKEIRPGPTAAQGDDALRVDALRSDRLAVAAAEQVGAWIAEGRDAGSIAILARVNSALLPVHAALASAGVPFSSTLDPTVLRRSVTSAALAWIRLALMPDDLETRDLIAAVTRPSRGLNRVARTLLRARRYGGVDAVRDLGLELEGRQATKWDGFCDDLEAAVQASASGNVGKVLDVVLDSVGLAGSAALFDGKRSRADRSSHSDDLDALRRAAAIHADASTFEPWLREQLAAAQDPEGVLLTTIHRVKGLEWDRVIVYGADRRLMPHFLSGDVEEERRIFHVALTRGREEVVVLADEAKPSPFLAEMREAARPEDLAPAAPRGADRSTLPEVGARVRISGGLEGLVAEHDGASARVRLETGATIKVEAAELTLLGSAAAGDADPGLADLLRAWRLETSRANGVPAYVVFTDRSLEEIAARKPVTLADLSVVHGIGPAKLEQYGEDIIELVADFTAT